ncbi:MAG: Ig-like domain-containing protein [Bacteroidota bacterium]
MKNLCRAVHSERHRFFKIGIVLSMALMVFPLGLSAQLTLGTDRPTANYELGQTANFAVQSSSSGTATYTITHDKFAEVISSGTLNLQAGVSATIPFNSDQAGVMLCTVTQNGQTAKAAAAFAPYSLNALEAEPADFDAFWAAAKSELAAQPLDPQLTPYRNTAYSTTYRINLAHIDNRRVYGYISIPTGSGPFPAILSLPSFGEGANVALPDESIAEKAGAISMFISIHNAEPDQIDPQAYQPDDIADPNKMYFKWAVLAGVRAIDYLASRPDFNGQLGVGGVSQGGGLAILLAGIDGRVKMLIHSNSTHCQHAGLKYEKASGFPYYLHQSQADVGTPAHEAATLSATAYYDAVHAARRFDGPSLTIISYRDETCPPATVFAAYNQLRGPKVLLHARDLAHDHPPEYWDGRFDFFRQHFPATLNPPWPWPGTTTGYLAEAGSDQNININDQASLVGRLSVNGQSLSSFPATWSLVEGPAAVNFADPGAYTTTASFSTPGRYVLRFSADDLEPLATNARFFTISDDLVVTVNGGTVDPAPKVELSTANSEVTGAFVVNVNFNENITGLAISDFVVNNAAASNLMGSGNTFTLQLDPQQEGEVTIQLPANRVLDQGNNGNEASNLLRVNFKIADTAKPEVELSTPSAQVSAEFVVNVNFNESISGLETTDFSVTNASIIGLSGSADQYVLNIQPLSEGQVRLQLPADRAVDGAGNGNLASNVLLVTYEIEDVQAPSVSLSSLATVVSADFEITANFDEPITGLQASDFIINNGTALNLSGSGASYTLRIAPQNPGQIRIQLPANRAADLAGNANLASNELIITYEIEDLQPPLVVLSSSNTEVMGNFSITATFSENITGLEAADFVISNGTALNLSGSGSSYALNIQPGVEGEVRIQLPADRAADLVGNRNLSSNELLVIYKVQDLQQPSVSLIGPSAEVRGEFEVAVNFSEAITGFESADVEVSNGTVSNLNGSGATYSLNILPLQAGEVHIQILADRVIDLAGNGNLISNELEVIYVAPDTQSPSVNLSTGSLEVNGNFEVQVSFDEAVTGLEAADFAISNGTALGLVGLDNFYRLQVMPLDEGEVSVALPANQAQDFSSNGNLASNLLILDHQPADFEPPTVELSTLAPVFNGAFTVTVKFNENVSGLELDDFEFNNGAAASLSGSGRVYRLTVNPQIPGKVFLQLPADRVVDEAGNSNTASNVLEVEYVDPNTALLSFNANGNGRRALLNWTTNTEYKNAYFVVERSADNINFEAIQQQPSLNDHSTLVNYQGEDLAPNTGDNYYRIRQVFTDSSFVFSNTERVILDFDVNSFVLFPNPAKDEVYVNFREFAGQQATIEIKDQVGILVYSQRIEELPEVPVRFDLGRFHDGVYYLSFSIKGTKRFSRKLVVIR